MALYWGDNIFDWKDIDECAEEFGTSRERISILLDKHNIPKRRKMDNARRDITVTLFSYNNLEYDDMMVVQNRDVDFTIEQGELRIGLSTTREKESYSVWIDGWELMFFCMDEYDSGEMINTINRVIGEAGYSKKPDDLDNKDEIFWEEDGDG